MVAEVGPSIRLSTAVHMSARFTYVSPPGTVNSPMGTRRVVDGGYFENSGALSAAQIIDALNNSCAQSARCDANAFRWVAIIISNNPNSPHKSWENARERYQWNNDSCQGSEVPHGVEGVSEKTAFLVETLSPVRALFATRSARGFHAEDALRELATPCWTIRFQMEEGETTKIPLGWMLSGKTQEKIYDQVKNKANVAWVGQLLEE